MSWTAGFYNSETEFTILKASLFRRAVHPGGNGRSHDLLEDGAECAVAAETALVGQLLGYHWLAGSGCLMVELDEVLDTQTVDVGIVGGTLGGKVLAEIDTVGANQFGKLGSGYVVLQVEPRILAILLQQRSNVSDGRRLGMVFHIL